MTWGENMPGLLWELSCPSAPWPQVEGSLAAAPYLSAGLRSSLSLPHRSHTGHEQAVLSSTATTVPGIREAERGSEAALAPSLSVPLRSQMGM